MTSNANHSGLNETSRVETAAVAPTRTNLFSPLSIRALTIPNRIAISPMCQYSAIEGAANDWHFAHLAKFALGGAGTIIVEATAVERDGRISPGDLALWHDGQIEPLRSDKSRCARAGSFPLEPGPPWVHSEARFPDLQVLRSLLRQ